MPVYSLHVALLLAALMPLVLTQSVRTQISDPCEGKRCEYKVKDGVGDYPDERERQCWRCMDKTKTIISCALVRGQAIKQYPNIFRYPTDPPCARTVDPRERCLDMCKAAHLPNCESKCAPRKRSF
jgi:hypothetical protein